MLLLKLWLGRRGTAGLSWHVAREQRSAQHLPALSAGVIRFALKFSPLKGGEAERWKGLLTEEVSVHKMKGNFRGIYLPSWLVWLKALRGLAAFILHRGCAQKILQMGLRWVKQHFCLPMPLEFWRWLSDSCKPCGIVFLLAILQAEERKGGGQSPKTLTWTQLRNGALSPILLHGISTSYSK